MSLLTLLVILLVLSVILGGWGTSRQNWGAYGWSPFGVILVILLVLFLTGNLALR